MDEGAMAREEDCYASSIVQLTSDPAVRHGRRAAGLSVLVVLLGLSFLAGARLEEAFMQPAAAVASVVASPPAASMPAPASPASSTAWRTAEPSPWGSAPDGITQAEAVAAATPYLLSSPASIISVRLVRSAESGVWAGAVVNDRWVWVVAAPRVAAVTPDGAASGLQRVVVDRVTGSVIAWEFTTE
jgi:hypothetical protein